MKKVVNVVLSLLIVFALIGCSSNSKQILEEVDEVVEVVNNNNDNNEQSTIEETIVDDNNKQEAIEETPINNNIEETLDPSKYDYWVVFYDQYGNELQRTVEHYGTTPIYKQELPTGFIKWTYKKTGKDVDTFKPITTNTYFMAVCNNAGHSNFQQTSTCLNNSQYLIRILSGASGSYEYALYSLINGVYVSLTTSIDNFADPVSLGDYYHTDVTSGFDDPGTLTKCELVNSHTLKLFTMPIKGSIIKLNDEKNYRVLKTDGTKAFVFAMDEVNATGYWNESGHTASFNGNTGVEYEGSVLDNYLDNTWYNSLNDGDTNITKPMYDAIQTTLINQNMYKYVDTPNDNSDFSGGITYKFQNNFNDSNYDNIIYFGSKTNNFNRHVFAIDIKDIYDYYEKNVVTTGELNKFFFGAEEKVAKYIWIRSADKNNSNNAWYYHGYNGALETETSYAYGEEFRPAFVIDLYSEGVTFTIQ